MKICLITCNIRFDNPADGNHAWSHRRLFLAETLLKHSPDIIATQEGRFGQLKDLESILSDYEIIDSHRSWIKERMYPAFYVKKSSFEICKSEDLWLSDTPEIAGSRSFGSAFPRLMTWMKIQPVDSAKNLLLINTHLDHVKEETRLSQVKVLIQETKRIWKAECPLIFMGDFNDAPDSPVRKLLESEFPGLQDSWRLFNKLEETSHHAFTGEMQNGARIDWILVDQKLEVENSLMDKSRQDGLFPTDHFPIVTTLKL
jgi:endonuclease/exonuclease/phosphatase family metal-dependent hydrolase